MFEGPRTSLVPDSISLVRVLPVRFIMLKRADLEHIYLGFWLRIGQND